MSYICFAALNLVESVSDTILTSFGGTEENICAHIIR